MSSNEPTNTQAGATQAGVTPTGTTPAGATKPVTEVKYDMVRFFAALFLVCVTCLLLMCLVSGRWFKTEKVLGVWDEVSIWGECQCVDINDSIMCSERERKTNAARSFSIIAAAFEFFAVVVLLWYPSGSDGKILIAIFSFLAAISLIITIAAWGNLFHENMCNVKLRNDYHLDWAYGIRIVEFVFVVVLAIVALVKPRGPGLVVFGILILYLTVFTTTSRGWASWKNHLNGAEAVTQEFGLFDYCACQRVGVSYQFCRQDIRLSRAAEAFEIIAVALSLVLTAVVVMSGPRLLAAPLAWFVFICQILVWIFMAAIWNERYCHIKIKSTPTAKLAWAFGLQVALSGLMIPTAILITLAGNRN